MTRSPQLPAKVVIRNGRYYYRDRKGGRENWIGLSRVDEGDHQLYKALAHLTHPSAETIKDLVNSYLDHGSEDLRPATIASYRRRSKAIIRVFGHLHPDEVETVDVAEYLETRKKQGHAPSGNREIAVLSSAYEYGVRHRLCMESPCRGVRRNKERPRRRYVRHSEFNEMVTRANLSFRLFLSLAYLTGLRSRDLRDLRRSQVTPDGILIEESKTGKQVLIEWSRDLQRCVMESYATAPKSEYVLTNTKGQPWTEWGLQSAMRKLRDRVNRELAEKDEPPIKRFTIHDIRAKAESDSEEGLGLMSLYKRQRTVKPVR